MIKGFYFLIVAALLAEFHPGRVGAAHHDSRLRKLTDTTNPDPQPEPDICFSAIVSVYVRDKGAISMRDLEVGDEVLSSSSPTNQYQRVYAFLHRKEAMEATFLQLETDLPSTKPLEITEEHLLYVQGKMFPVRAGSIVVGDVLQGEGGKPATVKRITQTTRQDGVYAPLTPDGTLLVDGIRASSYVVLKDLNDHPFFHLDMAFLEHVALSPFRFFHRWVLSPQKYAHSFNEEGIPPMVSLLHTFGSWIVRQSFVLQVLSILGYGVVAALFWIMECLLDSIFIVGIMTLTSVVVLRQSKIVKSI